MTLEIAAENTSKKLLVRIRESLTVMDIYTILILMIYTSLAVIFFRSVQNSLLLIAGNLLIISFIITIAVYDANPNAGKAFKFFRKIYFAPLILFIYSQVQSYIKVINPHDYDYLLIQADRWLFGTDPTHFLSLISSPVLTEYLQFSYMCYFFMPIIHGVELHLKHRDAEFNEFARIITFSFFASYILYFFLPAIGPRFTLHNFLNTDSELPGVWIAEFFRHVVNSGGGVPDGVANPGTYVNRDCMPSGHTWMTLVNIILSFRFKSKYRYAFLIIGSSLIFATVYLRYHYVIDVIAGAFFAIITFSVEKRFNSVLKKTGLGLKG